MDSGRRGRAGRVALGVYGMTTTIPFNGEELEVDFDYQKPCRGARDSYGVPLEPDDPEAVEINTVMFKGVDITFLLESRFDEIEEKVFEVLNEEPDYEPDYEEPMEWEDAA